MTTPRKNFNYNQPYAKPVQQQYPSQSEDYISFDMGGPTQMNNKAQSSNEKTPGRYNPKYYQQNYRNSNKQNRRNLFNNNYGGQQQGNQQRQNFNQNQQQYQHHNQQQNRYGHRNSNERGQQKQNFQSSVRENNSIASYIHPSMTEDPWFELMQRLQALEKSKISLKESTPPKDTSTPPLETNSNSDNDAEVDDDDDVDSLGSD